MELDRAAISRRIATAREQAGLTQPELAQSLSEPVHMRAVQIWERGQKNKKGEHVWVVPWDRLGEIAEITGMAKDWLLHGEEPGSRDPSVNERLDRIEKVLEALVARLARDGEAAQPRSRRRGGAR